MSYTKRDFVEAAYEELGFGPDNFDMQPEQLEKGLRKLDGMMATLNTKLRLPYPLPSSPSDSDLDQNTNVPDAANEAIYLALAIRLAPSMGKVVSNDLKASAKHAMDALLTVKASRPRSMQLPSTMPLGAGNKTFGRRRVFVRPPVEPLLTGPDGSLDFT